MSGPFARPLTGRELRRQAARQAKHKPQAGAFTLAQAVAPLVLLDKARPYDEAETAGEHLLVRAALDRLVEGSGDEADYIHVAMRINVSKVRALTIDAGLSDQLELAQDAMARAHQRHNERGRYGFDGPGLAQVREAIDAAETIVNASTPLQMRAARDVVADQLYGPGTAARLKAIDKARARRATECY